MRLFELRRPKGGFHFSRFLWFAGLALSLGVVMAFRGDAAADVFICTELLGRPTDTSVTVNALAAKDLEVYFEYGSSPGVYSYETDTEKFASGTPIEMIMNGLKPDGQYYYRMRYREIGATDFAAGTEHTFHTQRVQGSTFTVAIEADPHVDENTDPDTYRQTLQNILSETPDLLVDLGDTFMSDKLSAPTYQAVLDRALLLRSYYDIAAHSVPVFLALGNHEGEWGSRLTGSADNLPVWDTLIRKLYYPDPFPDGFYSGGSTEEKYVGLRESYYAWTWGDALLVVLDPYWYGPESPQLNRDWSLTLGRVQYQWLKRTLEGSRATFKFVFCHNLVGGWNKNGTGQMRGGVEAAKYLEWGGYNLDDTWGFDKARPGWAMPIHKLLVDNNVTIFFHGHDHFYGKQDLDGIVYQEVPQPGAKNTDLGNRAALYGYTQGRLLGGTGHLRLRVSPAEVKVDYVQTWTPANETGSRKNGQIGDSYTIPARDRSKASLTLGAGGSAGTETAGLSGSLQTGYAMATLSTGSTPSGNAVFAVSQNGVVVSEAAAPPSPPTTGARVFVDYGLGVSSGPLSVYAGVVDVYTGMALVNRGTAAANLIFTLRNRLGKVLALGHGTLGAGAHRARFVHELKNLAPDFVLPGDFASATRFGSLEISSDQGVSVTALRMTVNQRGDSLFTSVPIADLSQQPGTSTVYFPHIADGDGYVSTYILLNTSNKVQSGTLRFFADGGSALTVRHVGGTADSTFRYAISVGGTYLFQTDGSPVSAQSGSVQVVPDADSTTPVGLGIFSRTSSGLLVTESGIPSATPTTHARIYMDMANGHDSGLAIASIVAAALQVTLRGYQSDGSTEVGTQNGTLSVAGNGHKAAFVREWMTGLPAEFQGMLDITAPAPFVALTLRALTNERQDFLITTFPIVDMNRGMLAPLVFPHIADGGGYKTEFILLSAGNAAATTLGFFADDGSPLAVGK